MMKLHNPTSLFKQKRTWLIVGIVAAVIVIVVVAWSLASVRQTDVFTQADKTYNTAVKQAMIALPSSKASREQRLGALAALADGKNTKINCEGEWWNNWQQALLPTVKMAANDCEDQRERLDAITDAAKEVQAYLVFDAGVASRLASLRSDTKSKTWQQEAAAVANEVQGILAETETEALSDETKELLAAASKKTKTIVDAWQALNQASKKEDKEAYLTAQEKLSQAYADLSAISDVSDTQVEKTVQAFVTSAAKL